MTGPIYSYQMILPKMVVGLARWGLRGAIVRSGTRTLSLCSLVALSAYKSRVHKGITAFVETALTASLGSNELAVKLRTCPKTLVNFFWRT